MRLLRMWYTPPVPIIDVSMSERNAIKTTILSRFSFLLRLPVLMLLAHVYVAWRLASGMPEGNEQWATITMMVLVYLILITGFQAREKVGTPTADAVSWAGFLMLGFFSWLFVLTLLRDALLLLVSFIQVSASFSNVTWATYVIQYSATMVIGLSIAASVLGLFNARRRPAIVNIDIAIPQLPQSLDGFRIAQITDLHVGPTIKTGFVERVVDATNALNADVIVLTGDLVDGSVERLSNHTLPLSGLAARHGVYAVTGNHEYYVGATPWIAELRRLGIVVLLNEHNVLEHNGSKVVLAGVTDFGAERFDMTQASDPGAALESAPDDAHVKILLAHQPRSIFAAARFDFDLQLSGHTHGGQYWPWGYFVPLQQPFVAGLHAYQNMQIYISRGTGYWGPPLRMGARSEITHIRLRPGTNGRI